MLTENALDLSTADINLRMADAPTDVIIAADTAAVCSMNRLSAYILNRHEKASRKTKVAPRPVASALCQCWLCTG